MVKIIILLLFVSFVKANDKECMESLILKVDNKEIIHNYGKDCKDKIIFLKISHEIIELEGEIFKNIFFFKMEKQQFIAVFTLVGSHTNIVTFIEKISENKYSKVKNGVIASSIGDPFIAFDPLAIENSIVVKTRYSKIININKETCRILFENIYNYNKSKNEFSLITKDKELLKECIKD